MSCLSLRLQTFFKSSYLSKYRTFTTGTKLANKPKRKTMSVAKQKTKYAPGTVTLQVLGCGAHGAPASVYLFTDQSRYLFNCGEGTQRLAHEHKTKLSRLQHIFFTGKSWSNLGGLPGLALTAQDAGVTQITLHGPPELNTLFEAMNRFVVLKKINIDTESNDLFDDEVMTVEPVPIFSKSESQDMNASLNSNAVISYVCKLKPRPGALDLKKCVAKGVPPGPLLGLLKSGVDVQLDDGTIVKSAEVSEPTTGDQTVIFVEIPSEDYFGSLENKFSQHFDNAAAVIHFAPEEVASSKTYQSFVSKFNKETAHIFLNSSNRFSGNFAAHRIQIQLNQLHEKIFPILGEVENINEVNEGYTKRSKLICQPDNEGFTKNDSLKSELLSDIASLTCFRLRPFKGLDRSMEMEFTPDAYIKETHAVAGFTDALENLKSALVNDGRKDSVRTAPYPKITFLGTGSCIPNKTRNVSAILLQPKEDAFMLLDCGEGTLGQIIRFYGPSRWRDVIKNLKSIYISHLHADHHVGLIGVLKQRSKLLGKDMDPLTLFAPRQILPWLNYYNDVIEPINRSFNLIPNGNMVNVPHQSPALESMGISTLSTCLVKHCPHSFGVSVILDAKDELLEPIKITYSGDTMPCADLIDLGANSTVLIHEATMEDELIEEAKIKMHCTVSQALNVAQKMNAKNTILTHFSQRYAKLPRMPEGCTNNVAIAFDFMQVTMDDLKNFSLMYPVMKLMFSEHYEEMERKTQMRLTKSERKRKSNA